MSSKQNLILSEIQVRQIIRRIAFEIYENNFDEKHIVLVGIYDKGYLLADLMHQELQQIAKGVKTTLVRLDINKDQPLSDEVSLDQDIKVLKNRSVVLVDDVLNSGRTMAHSMRRLVEVDLKKLETAVLVNRSHKSFPISAKYLGYELSTTIDEHVDVQLEKNVGVYLH